jgi:hypothetical protein
MSALVKSLLLFALNWLDAQLTLFWVHSNIATEGNGLMNQLLALGDAPFMLVKLASVVLPRTCFTGLRTSRSPVMGCASCSRFTDC